MGVEYQERENSCCFFEGEYVPTKLLLRGSLAHWCRKMERPISCIWTWDLSSGLVGNHRLFASAERPNPCNDENREGPDGICTVVVILASGSSSESSSSSSCFVGCRLSV